MHIFEGLTYAHYKTLGSLQAGAMVARATRVLWVMNQDFSVVEA
jgi:hypothetical protein